MKYPETPRGDTVDVLHGVAVPDPYRWLEDPRRPETREWIEAQNALTFGYLDGISERAAIHQRLTQLWSYAKLGVPFREGGRLFYFKNDGLQNQDILYTAPSFDAPPRVLIDPNRFSEDGTTALAGLTVSRDGRRVAYGLSRSGSDWEEWHVRDVDTGEDLADHLRWVRYSSASFSSDGAGFFYSRYEPPPPDEKHTAAAYGQKLCWHRIGTPQSQDRVVYERPDQPEWGFAGQVTDDGRWLVIHVWHGTHPESRIILQELARGPDAPVIELLPHADAAYAYVGNDGERFWFRTDRGAPRGRIVEVDVRHPDPARWRELVPEQAATLRDACHVGGRLVLRYLEDAHARVRIHATDGELVHEVPLPGLGTVVGFDGHPDDTETWFGFMSFTTPTRIFRADVVTGEVELVWSPELRFDPDDYETTQVFMPSRDGTRVPMFLCRKRGLPDGPRPTYLYGYGGFNIPLTPSFDVPRLVWMERGGVLAVANLRGGGEYGESWYRAGTRRQKQNVFDDFLSCAEWLVGQGISEPARLAIAGSSNGGLLVGACLTQRPELFGAALADVGVLDMLRFHRFTIGWAWTSDYGSPDDAEDFAVLRAYSPLHNVRAGARYPATLITTADTDDRVVSAHSFKFAAALQAAQGGSAPVLIRIETKAGHGAGKPTAKLIELAADRLAFLVRVLGVDVPEPAR